MPYPTFLDVLFKIEESLNAKCELFDEVAALSKTDRTVRVQFEEIMRQAEADLKHRKYLMAKERERLLTTDKYEKDMAKMAKKELVRAEPGKKKMIRSNVPAIEKYQTKKKTDKKDYDLIKYFGDQVDFSNIPDEEPKTEAQEDGNKSQSDEELR